MNRRKAIMAVIAAMLSCPIAHGAENPSVSGQVTISKDARAVVKPGGALFIFAKKLSQADAKGVPPLAVLRIPDPKFPVEYSLSKDNAMMAGTAFEGPFAITARYSPSGDALDKSGPQGMARLKKLIQPGDKNIAIELQKK